MTRKIIVNMIEETVTLLNETCNFYEAGIIEKDKDIIEEHLIDRQKAFDDAKGIECDYEVVFEDV